jgi:hypothetical protein
MDKMQNDRAMFCLERYVTWLNYGGAATEDFRKLTELAQAVAREESTGPNRQKAMLAWGRKTAPISRRIATQYPTFPDIVGSPKRGGMPFFSSAPLRKRLRVNDLEACFAIGHFQELVAAGLLSNIGRCKLASCRRYFHGRTGKRFCSDECARKHMRQTPQFRKRNAEDQRKHYDKYFRKKPLARGPGSKQTPRRKSG